MNPPKFKKGDMVMYQAGGAPGGFFSEPEHNGLIGTIVSFPFPDKGIWRYPLDIMLKGDLVAPCEYCLRLIKDGDLKLDDIPLDVKEPA